jgi:SAM-dependent methyltransferase
VDHRCGTETAQDISRLDAVAEAVIVCSQAFAWMEAGKEMQVIKPLVMRLKQVTPTPVKTLLKSTGLHRLVSILVGEKYDAELSFQRGWAEEFAANRIKVLEYWRKYRYLDEIETVCKIDNDTKVLDVGCGISTVLHYIDGQRFGIDPLAEEYAELYDYPKNINIQKGFGEDIPFANRYFDIVFCSNVLDHTSNPGKVVKEIFRVLKGEGHLVLTVEIFSDARQRNPAHPHSFTEGFVYSLIESKFAVVFQGRSPWISLRGYVNGRRTSSTEELVMILKKLGSGG